MSVTLSSNPLGLAVGVIVRPVATLRQIADTAPWRTALVVATAISVANGIAGLTARAPALPPQFGAVPAGHLFTFFWARQWWFIVLSGLVVTPLSLLVFAAFVYAASSLLREDEVPGNGVGQRGYARLLSVLAFATVPTVGQLPVTLLNDVLRVPAIHAAATGLGFGVSIWQLVLVVLAIRESQRFSTGRSIGTICLSRCFLLVVGAVVGIVLALVLLSITYSRSAAH